MHLAFIRQDDFPPATGRVDGQGLLEALLDVWTPDTFSVWAPVAPRPLTAAGALLASFLTSCPAAAIVQRGPSRVPPSGPGGTQSSARFPGSTQRPPEQRSRSLGLRGEAGGTWTPDLREEGAGS